MISYPLFVYEYLPFMYVEGGQVDLYDNGDDTIQERDEVWVNTAPP